MDIVLDTIREHYHWQAALWAVGGIAILTMVTNWLFLLIPSYKTASEMNRGDFQRKSANKSYVDIHARIMRYVIGFTIIQFGVITPFFMTTEAMPWWRFIVDTVAILLVYDFIYYWVHRYVFHDSKLFGGPLLWVHSVHHRQHNPCRRDAAYLQPWELIIGSGLYVLGMVIVALIMGRVHVASVVLSYVCFTAVNAHNHDLWDDKFPIRYFATMSKMHHNHHQGFTNGNFATLSLLYDWMFGTLDYGKEGKPERKG